MMRKQGEFIKTMKMGLEHKKLSYSQKFMHYYEKSKGLRIGVGIGLGGLVMTNVLIFLPGTKYFFQEQLKTGVAKGYLELGYMKGIFIDTPEVWSSVLNKILYYTEKFKKDDIQNPWLIAMYMKVISECLKRSSNSSILFVQTLNCLGNILESSMAQNPKLVRNPDLRKSIMTVFDTLVKLQVPKIKFDDKDALNHVFNIFLIVCEYGDADTIIAYEYLIQLIHNIDGLRENSQNDYCVRRFFMDTMHTNRRIRLLSLNTLNALLEDKETAKFFVGKKLLSNLVSVVAEKFDDCFDLIKQIFLTVQTHNDIFEDESLKEEREKLQLLKKQRVRHHHIIDLVRLGKSGK